jgi:hypothetical protein
MADRWNYRRITPEEIATGHMDFANKAVLLDPGEFVARWEWCTKCGGGRHRISTPCKHCNSTVRVAVPVEVEK